MRAGEAVLMTAAAGASLAVAFEQSRWFAIAAAALATTALVVLMVHLALDLDGSAIMHGARAPRPPPERAARHLRACASGRWASPYQAAGRAAAIASEGALTDEEIDMFLPKSLHQPKKSASG